MSGTGTVEPTPTVEVEYKIINPTPTQLQELAEVASGGTITVGGGGASGSGSGGGTTSAPVVMTLLTGVGLTAAQVAQYWPSNMADAPPSPEGSQIKVVNGQLSTLKYLVDSHGNTVEFALDQNGNPIPETSQWGNGYQLKMNATLSNPGTGFNAVTIAQGQFWLTYNGGFGGSLEVQGAVNSGIREGTMPAFYTQTGSGSMTPNLPAMPAAPAPSAIKPGSSGNVILFGPGQTYTTISAAVAAANNGDTVKAAPSAVGVVFAESVAITKNIILDGGGTVTNAGTASPSFAGGSIIDGSSLADPSGYAHQLGGLVPMTDCVIKGFEIRGFGIHETTYGLTCGVRNGAAANVTVDNCWVHGNQNGLGGGGFPATWAVTNTWLQDNGIGDGHTHNAYFSTGNVSISLDHVTSTVAITGTNAIYATGQTNGGHAMKCRAPSFTATNFYFAAEDGSPLDLPDGTTQVFSCSTGTMAKSAAAPSHRMLAYGEESSTNGYAGGTLTGVTFDAACPNPFIQTMGGTITATGCTVNGGPITVTGGGTVTGLPA